MQQNKGIDKNSTINDEERKNVDAIFHTLSTMKIARIGKFFDSIKRCGVDVSDILMFFLFMPFFHQFQKHCQSSVHHVPVNK